LLPKRFLAWRSDKTGEGRTMTEKRTRSALANELRRTKDAERESEKRFRILIEKAPDMFFAHDLLGKFLHVNEQACIKLGYTQEELLSIPAQDIQQTLSFEQMATIWNALGKRNPFTAESVFRRKDGSLFPVEIRISPIDSSTQGRIIFGFVRDITERKQASEALQASLAEKEVLLMEVHHRVKNNLAAIAAMLEMQRQSLDGTASTALLELGGRIRSMALVHESLYQSGNFTRINFQKYFEKLIYDIRALFGTSSRIRCRVTADVEMSLDIAIPCGMIVNELISNDFKYAFPGALPRPGNECCEIFISMEWDGNTYTLIVCDNGVGLPAGFDWTKTKTLGLRLVKMLGQRQLQGEVSVDGSNGTRFMLQFSPEQGNNSASINKADSETCLMNA
jgi:PAS domain S-box-containing protein